MTDADTTTDLDTTPTGLPASAKRAAESAARKADRGGLSDATRRSYKQKWGRFEKWMRQQAGTVPMPPAPELVATFLETIRGRGDLAAPTLRAYASAIRHVCEREAGEDPTSAPEVRDYLKEVQSDQSARQPNRAKPLYVEDLRQMLGTCDPESMKGLRDRALLLVGYVGALRRSEIVQADLSHLERRDGEYLLRVPRQKNDPEGAGQWKGVPETGRSTSPAKALREWIGEAGLESGALFRSVDRWGNLGGRISHSSVGYVFRERLKAAGLSTEDYSTHSLRAGLVTQATEEGVAATEIQKQTGHASIESLTEYVRGGEALSNPAIREIGL